MRNVKRTTQRTLLVMAAAVAAVAADRALAQSSQSKLRFDVAAIRANRTGAVSSTLAFPPGGRFIATNQSARALLRLAFPQYRELFGLPDWAVAERYDVTATAGRDVTRLQVGEMVRALLEDRFQLQTHVEGREQDIYALLPLRSDGPLGPNLVPTSVDCAAAAEEVRRGGQPLAANGAPACGAISSGGVTRFSGISMDGVASSLSTAAGRTVINRTGLAGLFDYTLRFSSDPNQAIQDLPSIFTAVREQLGLRLEPARGNVDVLVIDHLERPATEN